jgi:hypothetical protein
MRTSGFCRTEGVTRAGDFSGTEGFSSMGGVSRTGATTATTGLATDTGGSPAGGSIGKDGGGVSRETTRVSTGGDGAAAAPTDFGADGGEARNQDRTEEKKRATALINEGRFAYRIRTTRDRVHDGWRRLP